MQKHKKKTIYKEKKPTKKQILSIVVYLLSIFYFQALFISPCDVNDVIKNRKTITNEKDRY